MSPHLFPRTKRDWVHLWYSTSLTLTIGMIVKEDLLTVRSGGKEGFHWSYDLVLAIAGISLLVASSRIRYTSWLLAIIGCIAAIAVMGRFALPVY